MSPLAAIICLISLMTTSVMTMEGRRHFKEDVKFSKTQWIIVGVCALKFPKNNDLYNNCINQQHIPRIWEEGSVMLESAFRYELHMNYIGHPSYISLSFQAAEVHSATDYCDELGTIEASADMEESKNSGCQVNHKHSGQEPMLYLLVEEQENEDYRFLAHEKAFTVQDYDDNPDQVVLSVTINGENTASLYNNLTLMVLSRHGLMLEQQIDMNAAMDSYLQQQSIDVHHDILIAVAMLMCCYILLAFALYNAPNYNTLGWVMLLAITKSMVGVTEYLLYLANKFSVLRDGESNCPIMRMGTVTQILCYIGFTVLMMCAILPNH